MTDEKIQTITNIYNDMVSVKLLVVRIREEMLGKKALQFENIVKYSKNFENIVVLGDFNHGAIKDGKDRSVINSEPEEQTKEKFKNKGLHNKQLYILNLWCIIVIEVIKLNMLLKTVLQEKNRIDYMIERYSKELSSLPKGSVSEKNVKGKIYYYLKYRDGKKVVSEYVRNEVVEDIRKQVNRRRHIETMLKLLYEEQKMVVKILEG